MKVTQDVREYAATKGISEQQALNDGMEEMSREFVKQSAEVYQKM